MNANKYRDIAGQRFGLLVAQHIEGRDSTKKTTWKCHCDCGNETVTTLLNLTMGTTKSCGCLRKISKRREDLTKMRFGMLVAVSMFDGKHWSCLCDCGSSAVVATVHLKRNHTRSCGCLRTSKTPTRKQLIRRGRNALTGWAKAVKDAASGVCDCCGSSAALHAHHIMPFSLYPSLSSNLENGAALCNPCHRAIHRRISKGVNSGLALAQEMAHVGGFDLDALIKYSMRAGRKPGANDDDAKALHYKQKLDEVVGA